MCLLELMEGAEVKQEARSKKSEERRDSEKGGENRSERRKMVQGGNRRRRANTKGITEGRTEGWRGGKRREVDDECINEGRRKYVMSEMNRCKNREEEKVHNIGGKSGG